MLHIIRSNRVEALLDRLAAHLAEAPLASPFTPEILVAPSPAMARWVHLGLAQRLGVAANLDYPLPASFVWSLCHRVLGGLPDSDPLAPAPMAWALFARLPGRLEEPAFAPPRQYLGQDPQGLKRWQLANRVAEVFDRYQFHRPDWIRRWEHGGDADWGDDWQALLWRQLAAEVGRHRHRVAVIQDLARTLAGPDPVPGLPERVSLFAPSSLPPLLMEAIHALAGRVQVDLYLHAPTPEFWADLVSQKAQARKRLAQPEVADLWEVGHSLLASWGRQGQALQDQLLERDTPLHESDAFVEPADDPDAPLLARLHRDIFQLRPIPPRDQREAVAADDDSIQVHLCHSPLRECQVLHDQLLALFAADPALHPEDVLVMVPEIHLYAPYIEAVFSQEGGRERPFIPWNLSDIGAKDEHPLARVFLQGLELTDSRFRRSEILSFLDVPELAGRFGLDGEAVAWIKDWLERANLRWGLDGDHKQRHWGLPAEGANTWAQAEQRLFGGYALGGGEPFADIAPVDGIEGDRAEALGRFWHLITRLRDGAARLATARPVAAWQADLLALLADWFGDELDAAGQLQRIRDAIADLAEQAAGLEEPLSPALARAWLGQALESAGRHGRYFSGGVTFCGLRPLRGLPFPVIAVLGLQDLAFPRRDRPAEFDRLRDGWRPGDPRKGDEDRYLFLETLLCARRCLYLSYQGRDPRGNQERQPSVLLRELLDDLDQRYRVAGAPDEPLGEHLTRVHPMQPFSPRVYGGERGGYDGYWCAVAKVLQEPPMTAAPRPWPDTRLPPAPERSRELSLAHLEQFASHPVRYFVRHRLRVDLREEDPGEDAEPFSLDGLESFGLKHRLVSEHLRGRVPTARQFRAEGRLPHGGFADLSFETHAAVVTPLVERLADYRGQRPLPLTVDLRFEVQDGIRRLGGPLGGVYPGLGLLRWKPARLKGGDLLGLWLHYLAWCASGMPGPKRGALHALDGAFLIETELDPAEARAALAAILSHYWEGLHRPLPLLPKASYAFALAARGDGDTLKAARGAWDGKPFQNIPGDQEEPYIQFIRRGLDGDPLDQPEFAQLAEDFYDPPLTHGVWR